MSSDNPFSIGADHASPIVIEGPARLASPGTRLGARLIDGLFMWLAAVPGASLLCLGGYEALWFGLSAVLLGVCALVIYNFWLIVTDGVTIGKRSLGIRIVRLDGRAVGLWDGVLVREFAVPLANAAVVTLTGFGPLNIIDALFIGSNGHRTLHDRIAGTQVVDASPHTQGRKSTNPQDSMASSAETLSRDGDARLLWGAERFCPAVTREMGPRAVWLHRMKVVVGWRRGSTGRF